MKTEESTAHDPLEQVAFAGRLDELHQLLYTRGGIRPSNAAVEELTKLLLLRIACERDPELRVGKRGTIAELLEPETIRALPDLRPVKEAFAIANSLPDLGGRAPDGKIQPVWPSDEPLRISRSDILAEAVDILWSVPLATGKTLDLAGTAFDVFLRKGYHHAGGLGTYLTPATVVQAMATIAFELVDPLAGDSLGPSMGDPCCGSGRFLVGLIEEARRRSGVDDVSVFGSRMVGADQSSAAVAMARVNLLAYGFHAPEVFVVEDSITDSNLDLLRGQLKLILTNPPFGDGKYDSEQGIARTVSRLPGLAGKTRIDPALAFFSRCMDLLAPGGVVGIILPDGVADGPHLRELLLKSPRLMDDAQLEGVISLPSATFAPAGTTAKTSVVFVRKAEPDRQRKVFLARADHVGYLLRKGAIAADPEGDDLPSITDTVSKTLSGRRARSDRGYVTRADIAALVSVDAASIDERALEARTTLLDRSGREFRNLLSAVRKRRADAKPGIPFISVLHVDELGNVDWIEASRYQPSTPGIGARAGEILISLLNPRKFRATVVPETFELVHCSAEFGVFAPSVDPYAILALLQHPLVKLQIAPLGRGTSSSRRRIDEEDVLSLIAPPHDDDWMIKAGREVQDALASISEARVRLSFLYGDGAARL